MLDLRDLELVTEASMWFLRNMLLLTPLIPNGPCLVRKGIAQRSWNFFLLFLKSQEMMSAYNNTMQREIPPLIGSHKDEIEKFRKSSSNLLVHLILDLSKVDSSVFGGWKTARLIPI